MPFDSKRYEDVQRILGEPELYPAELLSWMLKKLTDNPYFQISEVQLPMVDDMHLVGNPGEAAFNSDWTNYGSGWHPMAYWKDPWGNVFLNGLVKKATGSASGTTIFTLPQGYRPKYNILWAQDANSITHCRVDVNPAGTVSFLGSDAQATNYVGVNMFFKAFT